MDKYEFNLKVEQIRKLAAKKQYKEASAIAKDMNWTKVKDWSTLATVINVHEAVGDFEEARDMAILAYNRNLGGRKLIYKLTEFLIKLQDFDNADQLYDEYEKVSQHDVNRFILFYDLRKAENASNNELIEILEDYKEHEIDEKYMYELAELYYKTKRKEECVKICDDIVLWFQDGIYVEKAVKLKRDMNVNLTNTQKQIFDNIQIKKQDIENTRELAFEEQKELARIMQDDVEDVFKEDEVLEEPKEEPQKVTQEEVQESEEKSQESQDATDEVIDMIDVTEEGAEAAKNGIDKASMSLKELIENAKKKLADSYDQISQEAEQEKRIEAQKQRDAKAQAMDIEVEVPDYNNLYNTQNIQEQLAKNMSDIFAESEASLEPQPIVEETTAAEEVEPGNDQIEGQISLADWFETVQEERYGKQNTREFSKAELDRMLDEKDEKSAAYERLMAEQKQKADAKGEEFDEEAARRMAKAQMMINAAKTDLAIRTGKATVRLEEAAALHMAAVKPEENAVADESEVKEAATNVTLETAQLPKISEALLSSAQGIIDEENKEVMPRELDDVDINTESRRFKKDETERAPMNKVDELDTEVDENKKLSGELTKFFRKYREMPGLESQLVDYFSSIGDEMNMNNSLKGNILISGNSSSDKVDLARTIVRALNHLYPDRPKKIAKTTGDSINHRGIVKAMGKLKGTVLIVEGAGAIQPKRIAEIMNCLAQDTDRMIIIFEDSDAEMNVLLNFNPQLTDAFNHRIILKQYTVNELVEMARKFARKRQYEVDDDALLQLYLKIDQLHNSSDNIRLDDIKEIINKAIVRSEKRASKRFFGGLKKKRSENGDVIFLSEADFKD